MTLATNWSSAAVCFLSAWYNAHVIGETFLNRIDFPVSALIASLASLPVAVAAV